MKTYPNYLEQARDVGIRGACHVQDDPLTGVIEFSLFTDDGRGNGDHLFTVKLADLLKIATAYAEETEQQARQEFFRP